MQCSYFHLKLLHELGSLYRCRITEGGIARSFHSHFVEQFISVFRDEGIHVGSLAFLDSVISVGLFEVSTILIGSEL